MSRGALLCVAALVACLVAVNADICPNQSPKYSMMGANFDVSALMRTGDTPDYTVTDGDIPCTPNVEQNFTYVFDVCAPVTGNNKPSFCNGITSPALQYDPKANPPVCYNLGNTGTFSLINNQDPSQGLQLTYTGGQQCNHGGMPFRQVTLMFGCSTTQIPTPTVANEPSHCHYVVEMNSVFGCPLECPLGGPDRELCGGHGLCGYDKTNKAPKCFCDTGYAGVDCSTAADDSGSGGNGAIIGLLVTLLLVAVVLGVVLFFVVRMLKAYRQDAHNYMAMHNQDLGTQDI